MSGTRAACANAMAKGEGGRGRSDDDGGCNVEADGGCSDERRGHDDSS